MGMTLPVMVISKAHCRSSELALYTADVGRWGAILVRPERNGLQDRPRFGWILSGYSLVSILARQPQPLEWEVPPRQVMPSSLVLLICEALEPRGLRQRFCGRHTEGQLP